MADEHPTFEAAKRCPRCDMPGEDVSTSPAKDRRGRPVAIHNIFCRNEQCRWFNTPWIVQVNQDGTVPPPTQHKRGDIEKMFPDRDFGALEEARVVDAIQKQLDQETRPGGGELGRRR